MFHSDSTVTPLGLGNYQYVLRIHNDSGCNGSHVLKIPKHPNVNDYILRKGFKKQVHSLLNELEIPDVTSNNICSNEDSVLCIIDRTFSKKIRQMFYNLLNKRSNEPVCDGDPDSQKGTKFLIYYDTHLEKSHSLHLPKNSIYPFRNDLNQSNFELCTLELDLFNFNNVSQTFHPLTNGFGANTQNVTFELKLKCGLNSFPNYPHMFKLKQMKKRNIEHVYTNGCDVLFKTRSESHFNPYKFFTLDKEAVKSQINELVKTPQNNLRVFIDGYQSMIDKLTNSEDHSTTHKTETQRIINMAADSIVENRDKFGLLLKLQAMAAGHEFTLAYVYSLYRLFRICSSSKARVQHNEHSIRNIERKLNTRILKNDLGEILAKFNLDSVFTQKSYRNYYFIKRIYNQLGVNIIKDLLSKISCFYDFQHTTNVILTRHLKSAASKFNQRRVVNKLLLNIIAKNDFKITVENDNLTLYNISLVRSLIGRYLCRPSKISLDFTTKVERYIYMYLCGKVAMDLSVIINILYHRDQGYRLTRTFTKVTFIDVDLKSIRNVYKLVPTYLKPCVNYSSIVEIINTQVEEQFYQFAEPIQSDPIACAKYL